MHIHTGYDTVHVVLYHKIDRQHKLTVRFTVVTTCFSRLNNDTAAVQQYITTHCTMDRQGQHKKKNSPCDPRSLQTRARGQVAEVGLLLVLLAHGHLLEHLAAQPRLFAGLAFGDVERLREGGEVRADGVLLQASVLARPPAGRPRGGCRCECDDDACMYTRDKKKARPKGDENNRERR